MGETGYIDTFKRYEIKYLLGEAQYRAFCETAADRLVPDEYGHSTISNIYFDTPDRRMIRASLEKPLYKEKLRIRSYKTPTAEDTVFVELKKKYKGVVYKRRIDLTLAEAEDYLYKGRPLKNPSQISREIDYVLSYYPGICPAAALFYDRNAFYSAEDPNLRVTFDSKIIARQTKFSLADGPGGEAILNPEKRLMEIKTTGAIPLWLTHLLDKLKIYPTSFSKYGRAYELEELVPKLNGLTSAEKKPQAGITAANEKSEKNERKIICA